MSNFTTFNINGIDSSIIASGVVYDDSTTNIGVTDVQNVIEALDNNKINKSQILQSSGTSTTDIMSQYAVTNTISASIGYLNTEMDDKFLDSFFAESVVWTKTRIATNSYIQRNSSLLDDKQVIGKEYILHKYIKGGYHYIYEYDNTCNYLLVDPKIGTSILVERNAGYIDAVVDDNNIVRYFTKNGNHYNINGRRYIFIPVVEKGTKLIISSFSEDTVIYKLSNGKRVVDKIDTLDTSINILNTSVNILNASINILNADIDNLSTDIGILNNKINESSFFNLLHFNCDGDSMGGWLTYTNEYLNFNTCDSIAEGNATVRDRSSNTSGVAYYPQWAPDAGDDFIDYKKLSNYSSGTAEYDQAKANNCLYGHLGKLIKNINEGNIIESDIFVLNIMGVNDTWTTSQITSILGDFDDVITGDYDKENIRTTILGGLRWYITLFRKTYKNCQLFYKTSTQQTKDTHTYFYQVHEPILKLMRYLSVPIIDSYGELGIMTELEHHTDTTDNQWTSDGTHPTTDGYKKDGKYVAMKIKNWFSVY